MDLKKLDDLKDSDYKLPIERILNCHESVTERYYEPRFYRNQWKPECDQCVLLHSNRYLNYQI